MARTYRKSNKKKETIGGHNLTVMPSKRDGIPCSACKVKISEGESISPYKPSEMEDWMYGPSVWLHSACVAQCLDGDHPIQQEITVSAEEAKAYTSSPRSPGATMTGKQVAMCVMVIEGLGKMSMPAFFEGIILSAEQGKALIAIVNSDHNAQVIAGPGCGKSFFIAFLSWVTRARGIYLVFNSAMKQEVTDKGEMFPNVGVYTTHGCGRRILADNIHPKRVKMASDKVRLLTWDSFPSSRYDKRDVKATQRLKARLAGELVPHVQSQLMEGTPAELRLLMEKFNISTGSLSEREVSEVLNEVPNILEKAKSQALSGRIDFNDMIHLPASEDWAPKPKAWVFVDESQDLSPAQIKLALSCAGTEGRVIMVGDPLQAIYTWRGAASNGMDSAYETLKATPKGCIRLYLMGTYRTPRSGVALCNLLYPYSKNPLTTHVDRDGFICQVPDNGDNKWLHDLIDAGKTKDLLILCRCNAPLVQGALACLKAGIKAVIRGRDFSAALVALIKKVNDSGNNDIGTFLAALDLYSQLESDKAARKGVEVSQTLSDQVQCLQYLSDGCAEVGNASTPNTLLGNIAAVFADTKEPAVTFSTIHQAKGLEAPYIAILKPNLMPGPWAETKEQWEEERHIQWVAYSRHQHALIFVGEGLPPLPPAYKLAKLEDAIAADPFTKKGEVSEDVSEEPTIELCGGGCNKPANATAKGVPICGLDCPAYAKAREEEVSPQAPKATPRDFIVAPEKAPKAFYRLSTTIDTRTGEAREDRGVDCCKVASPDGRNIGGAKRTNRTGGWRDRILQKLGNLSGLSIPSFGDKKSKHKELPSKADWEAIEAAINALPNAEAYLYKPSGWKMWALIVEVN